MVLSHFILDCTFKILAPASPAGLAVAATGTTTMSVTWSSQTADSFKIFYSPTDDEAQQTKTVDSETDTSTAIENLTAGTSYTVYIIAVFNEADSIASSDSTVYTSK